MEYDLSTVKETTNNFSEDNKIGHGGFGFVYKVWRSWRDGTLSNIIDPILLKGSSSLNDIVRSIHIALLCVQNNVLDRPTMYAVGLMLNSFSLTLQVPSEPAFFIQDSLGHGASGESSKGSGSLKLSANNASISEMTPR
ncbi:hypothetical protein L1987_68987 [Smallanthus sonchifolius]|uniref:Uncharacterized protein n=1 Tax=Smallanthus sonchifolius TaxID=185202 RepID=A0ACB9B652_9ASTR|nr:hypothetical protein L1987_68987 [Smallanthus sonchifolius]